MPHDVYISYSMQKDQKIADTICKALRESGISYWIASDDILYGQGFTDIIPQAIKGCQVFLLVLSKDSDESKFVQREVQLAVKQGKIIIPFCIENGVPITKGMDLLISTISYLNATEQPIEQHLPKLATLIKDILIREQGPLAHNSGKDDENFNPLSPHCETHESESLSVDKPQPQKDKIDFSITAPQMLIPDDSYNLDVWAHLPEQYEQVVEQAKRNLGGKKPATRTRSGVQVQRGSEIKVRLALPNFIIDENTDQIIWDGDPVNATFGVRVPPDLGIGNYDGVVYFYINELQIVRLNFTLKVGQGSAGKVSKMPSKIHWIQRAFASYAHEDKQAALSRVQGIQKGNKELKVFVDVVELRSGEDWQKRIEEEIGLCDVLYLFWSEAASHSEWVEKEWRMALQMKGLEFIDPVPLTPPEKAPPPPELSSLHFNDVWLVFMGQR